MYDPTLYLTNWSQSKPDLAQTCHPDLSRFLPVLLGRDRFYLHTIFLKSSLKEHGKWHFRIPQSAEDCNISSLGLLHPEISLFVMLIFHEISITFVLMLQFNGFDGDTLVA